MYREENYELEETSLNWIGGRVNGFRSDTAF
jgi:hypothetical protein